MKQNAKRLAGSSVSSVWAGKKLPALHHEISCAVACSKVELRPAQYEISTWGTRIQAACGILRFPRRTVNRTQRDCASVSSGSLSCAHMLRVMTGLSQAGANRKRRVEAGHQPALRLHLLDTLLRAPLLSQLPPLALGETFEKTRVRPALRVFCAHADVMSLRFAD